MIHFIKKLGNKICKPFKWVKRTVENFILNFIKSSKWFIRMWNNHDWDGDFLIEMMVYKMKDIRYQLDVRDRWFVDLRHQPKNIDDKGESSETEDHLEGLDKAIEIGERIIKNDYVEYTPSVKKWFDEHDFFSNEKMPDDIHKQWRKCHDIADKRERKDRKDFFNIIRDNNQLWWS